MAISPIAYGPPIATGGGGGGGAPVDATYITRTADATLTAETALSALATGILKSTTGTGALSIAGASDLPAAGAGAGTYGAGGNVVESVTLDAQGRVTGTTTVAAGGGGGAPVGAKYIVQTADATLTAEQALGALATGILKNTTTTGVLSIATAGTDYVTPTGTAPIFINGSGLTSSMLTILNDYPGTGINLRHTNSRAALYFTDSAGANATGYLGHATGNNDFITGTVTGDVILGNQSSTAGVGIKIRPHGSGGTKILGPTVNIGLLVDDNGVSIDGTGLTAVDVLTVKNAKNLAGLKLQQATATTSTGFAIHDNAGTQQAVFGLVGNNSDWAGNLSAGTVVLFANQPVRIKSGTAYGVTILTANGDASSTGGQVSTSQLGGTIVGYGTSKLLIDSTTFNISLTAPIVAGATTSAGTFTLSSTTHATKGKMYLNAAQTITVDEANVRLGVGTGSPSERFHLTGGIAKLDGNGTHVLDLPADATGNATAATGRIPIKVGAATKYIRYFDD